MAAPALCRAFSQNAWRRDFCSNCFRSKEEHKAAAATRQKTPTDAAQLAVTAVVKSILKESSKSSNSVGKKGRNGVSFHKEESQVIGYGGDDEIHSEEEGNETEEVETPDEEIIEREKAELQALERLTKANTDFNSVIANLQWEGSTQEKPSTVKGNASGIPVPGGRTAYTGPLRLGLGSKDSDGNKKTLLVSVRPFGSDGEEVGKTVNKTKILVANGYGNGTTSNGNTKEPKDISKPAVNGTLANGYGLSSSAASSKEASVKVNVSSSGSEAKSSVANGVNSSAKVATSASNVSKVNGNLDTIQADSKIVNGSSDQEDVKTNNEGVDVDLSLGTKKKLQSVGLTENGKASNLEIACKSGVPVPASRILHQQTNLGGSSSVVSKNGNGKINIESSLNDNKIPNGLELDTTSKITNSKEEDTSLNKESTKVKNNKQASLTGDTVATPMLTIPNQCNGSRSADDADKDQDAPVPAERNVTPSHSGSPSKENILSENESNLSNKITTKGEQEEKKSEASSETTMMDRSTPENPHTSSTSEVCKKETQGIIGASHNKAKSCVNEPKNIRPPSIHTSQSASMQPSKKNPEPKNIASKPETQQSLKKPDDGITACKTSNIKSPINSAAAASHKSAPVTKRPAPSILKMGVPTGWNSKNTTQKNVVLTRSGRDTGEERVTNEKANPVNGIIKTQPITDANVGQEKSLKPANTIAKLRANFVNNNLKIIAESAAKIVNGTKYGTKNAVANEIPITKSSVMNLSMRPISLNSRPGSKSFHADDCDLKDQRVKALSNFDKVSNSFPSIRAKGSGPDIRELLRTPERENESIEFPVEDVSKKVSVGAINSKSSHQVSLGNIEHTSKDKTLCSGNSENMTVDTKTPHVTGSKDQEEDRKRENVILDPLERAGVVGSENIVMHLGAKLQELSSSTNEVESMQSSLQVNDEVGKLRLDLEAKSEVKSEGIKEHECSNNSTRQDSIENDLRLSKGESSKAGSPNKVENGSDKTPPGEKSRKKGIVRRILFKSGNEIYRKAGEMVRSVRRSNESKEEVESSRESEVQKEASDLILISKKPITSEVLDSSCIPSCDYINSETGASVPHIIEEAVNPAFLGLAGECTREMAKSNQERGTVIMACVGNDIQKEPNFLKPSEAEEVEDSVMEDRESEKTTSSLKAMSAVPCSTQPPVMSPRPSFLHGKSSTTQSWSSQSPRGITGSPSTNSAPGTRSERAASVSAVASGHVVNNLTGQRGRLSSLPASASEVKAAALVHTPQGTQVTLRKPGPIISGVKPAIPAKPSKILEASAARQGANQQLSKPVGERKGSPSVSTPGSVGRSAGKRQAPKPPGMDSPQRKGSVSGEVIGCQNEALCQSDCDAVLPCGSIANQVDSNRGEKLAESSVKTCLRVNPQEDMEEGSKECAVSGSAKISDGSSEITADHQNQASHLPNLSNSAEVEAPDDSLNPPRGTHFVKNQVLNASKSSSRVARETERRHMLIQLQSSTVRGPVPQPDGSTEVPDSILQMTASTGLSARQRSASLGRGVGVANPRPPLPGGSLGRVAGEGAALSVASSTGTPKNTPVTTTEPGVHEGALVQSPSTSAPAVTYESSSDGNNKNVMTNNSSPVRSRSEGSLAVPLPVTPSDDGKLSGGTLTFEMPVGGSLLNRGEEIIYDSPSGLSLSGKKKRNTVRGFLKFLRRGSLRDDPSGTGYENREEVSLDCETKTRPIIVHPLELDGACVEVVKGGSMDVRRKLEEESALEMTRSGEITVSSEQLQSSPRRPTSISIAPPRPPPAVLHSPSSPSLSSSSSSSSGSTPIRPRPPPPPRGLAPVPPSPGGSGQKPARPPPPKPAHLMRLGLLDREVPGAAAKSNSGDGIYANLGEVRATLAPCKPQRTASMREVLAGASGKANGEAPTPRIIPRNAVTSSCTNNDGNSTENTISPSTAPSSHPTENKEHTDDTSVSSVSTTAVKVHPLECGDKTVKPADVSEMSKSDKVSWNVGVEVMPGLTATPGTPGVVGERAEAGTDSSSEEDNSAAPPLPLAPPPSLPPPLPLHPPPSPPSHATSSSSSSSVGNALILPEDSGYESVEFHGVLDGEVNAGRWWSESGIVVSRGSVVTATADSLEESYEAVVGANHRALADVLAQVCQPNPEEFSTHMTLRWSDFLVEGPKGGVMRAVGPISFHRAALKGRASSGARDQWRRVTLGISAAPSADELPQYFRGCMSHDGGNAPIGRCMPSLRPMCTFQDEIPNRFFSSDSESTPANLADLLEATVMVFNPLHLYSLKAYLLELITERKSGQSFPPLPEESNWCNRACLFLLILLDTLCSLECCSGEDALCVIREEAKPSPVVAPGDGQLGEGCHLTCPLPRLCVIPNENSSQATGSSSSPALCFQGVVKQIVESIDRDSGAESFSHALNCVLGLLQGNEDALSRSRAVLELWFFGPPIFHGAVLHSPGEKIQEGVGDIRDASRWSIKTPVLSLGDTEPLSVEGELLSATPRRWLDLERAGALRSLAVNALHRGSRVPSPLESGLESSNAEEGMGPFGKCCRGWRVGEIGGHPSLPTCEEARLRFLVGTSGSEVAEAWELLARGELSSPTSVSSLGRTYVDGPMRKLTSWTIASGPEIGEAQC